MATLKIADGSFMRQYEKIPNPKSGLRPPNVEEAYAASEELWKEVSLLVNDQLLPPRPAAAPKQPAFPKKSPTPTYTPKGGKRDGKGKADNHDIKRKWEQGDGPAFKKRGDGGKGGLEAPANWAFKTAEGKPICIRFNKGKCQMAGCKFLLACAVKVRGVACGALNQPAIDHANH